MTRVHGVQTPRIGLEAPVIGYRLYQSQPSQSSLSSQLQTHDDTTPIIFPSPLSPSATPNIRSERLPPPSPTSLRGPPKWQTQRNTSSSPSQPRSRHPTTRPTPSPPSAPPSATTAPSPPSRSRTSRSARSMRWCSRRMIWGSWRARARASWPRWEIR